MSKPKYLTAPKYTRIFNEAMSRPLCVTAEMKRIIFDLLIFRAQGGRLTVDELRARIGDDDDDDEAPPSRTMRVMRPAGAAGGAIGVVPIYGVIAHRTFEASSGMTSTDAIQQMLRSAVNNSEVSAILLDVSSPGGGVTGVPELAAEIYATRKVKPVWAIANGLAASAGYWLASAAEQLFVIPSGEVGSIGVYSLHEDYSKWLEKQGIAITAISAGDRKLEGNPWEPLDEDAKAHFQKQVDEIYVDFVKAVAKGRNVTTNKVEKTFGQGRVFTADEALALGMVDGIATFDQVIAKMSVQKPRAASTSAARVESESDVCPRCNGSGLEAETYMGDPAGQETCTVCGGTGRANARTDANFGALELDSMRMALDLDADRARELGE